MKPAYFSDDQITLYHGDSLAILRDLPDQSVDCCVTSPPYFGLRDYGEEGQYGLEASPAEYVETMRALFAEVRRVLADDGTLWLNLGDSYASDTKGSGGASSTLDGTSAEANGQRFTPRKFTMGVPPKNLLGIPWRVAFALQDDGWTLRNAIVWHKPNAMPESVTDRLSNRYEPLFMFSKSPRYWFDLDPIREGNGWRGGRTWDERKAEGEPMRYGLEGHAAVSRGGFTTTQGRNPGDVWIIATQPFSAAHFAVYPVTIPERCILAGCKPGGVVLDPFSGSGTTGLAATKHGRKYIGVDLSREYLDLSLRTRFAQPGLDLGGASA